MWDMKGGDGLKANLLRGEIVANGLTVQEVAEKMGLSRNTLFSRLSGQTSFNTEEVIKLCDILHIKEPSRKVEIFLT